MEPVDIPARLRELRQRAGISQRLAARAASVNPSTWARWEQGHQRPTLGRARAIATALDIPVCGLDPPAGLTAVADLYLTRAQTTAIRTGGHPAAEQLAAQLAAALTPAILNAARTAPAAEESQHGFGHPRAHFPARRLRSQRQAAEAAALLRLAAAGGEGAND